MGAQYPLRLASNVVLTALLAPEIFGLMATVTVLHIGLVMISDVGILQSVVRSPEGETPRFLRVAWTVQAIRGVAIALSLLGIGVAVSLLGPSLAPDGTVYADPRLPWIIWASSIVMLARGLESGTMLLAKRRMRIGRITAIEITAQVVSIAVTIGFAAWSGTYWAPVLGMIAGGATTLALSHTVLVGPAMRLTWDSAQAVEMWRFGRWLIGSSIGGYFLKNGDRLIFGAMMDSATLGIYSIAAMWAGVAGGLLGKVVSATAMPVLSEVINRGDSAATTERMLLRICALVSAAAGVAAVALAAVSDLIVITLYDERYASAAPFMALLAIRLCFTGSNPLTAYLTARGRTSIVFAAIAMGAALACTVPILLRIEFGLPAMIAAFSASLVVVPIVAMALSGPELLGRPARAGLARIVLLQSALAVAIYILVI